MDILHRRGRATVAEVMSELSGEPAYSTVRAQLRVLEEKGHIRHEEEQLRYVYLPAQSPSRRQPVRAQASSRHVLSGFAGAGRRSAARQGRLRRLARRARSHRRSHRARQARKQARR